MHGRRRHPPHPRRRTDLHPPGRSRRPRTPNRLRRVIDLSIDLPAAAPPAPKGPLRPLLTPLPQPGHYLLVIDNSAMEVFTKCPTAPDEYRTVALALQVMKHYRIRQALPDYEWSVLSDGAPIIERPFELHLGV